jgi:hypothetical protein
MAGDEFRPEGVRPWRISPGQSAYGGGCGRDNLTKPQRGGTIRCSPSLMWYFEAAQSSVAPSGLNDLIGYCLPRRMAWADMGLPLRGGDPYAGDSLVSQNSKHRTTTVRHSLVHSDFVLVSDLRLRRAIPYRLLASLGAGTAVQPLFSPDGWLTVAVRTVASGARAGSCLTTRAGLGLDAVLAT